jgi:hypothetical protein
VNATELLTARENDQYYARQWIYHADQSIDDDSESCARPLPMRARTAERGTRGGVGGGVAWPRTGGGIFVGANLAVTAAPPALRSSPLAQFLSLFVLLFPRSADPRPEPARAFGWASPRQRELWLAS